MSLQRLFTFEMGNEEDLELELFYQCKDILVYGAMNFIL